MNVLPEKCQNFRNLEGGGGCRPLAPPGQYTFVTLLSWVQVCCLKKNTTFVFCFALFSFYECSIGAGLILGRQ